MGQVYFFLKINPSKIRILSSHIMPLTMCRGHITSPSFPPPSNIDLKQSNPHHTPKQNNIFFLLCIGQGHVLNPIFFRGHIPTPSHVVRNFDSYPHLFLFLMLLYMWERAKTSVYIGLSYNCLRFVSFIRVIIQNKVY